MVFSFQFLSIFKVYIRVRPLEYENQDEENEE